MSARTQSRFLDLRALAALERLRFTTRQRIEGTYSGRHQSRQLGGAGEFVDYREYSGGEDLRRLDWKVLARTGKAFVRIYQDETNLPCMLAVDASGSMSFGAGGKHRLEDSNSPAQDQGSRFPTAGRIAWHRGIEPRSKIEYTQFLTTAFTHVISRAQDQVGLAIMGETLREFVPPRGTATHVALVQELIEKMTTRPAKRMGDALRELFERSSRRGVLMLVSDFLMDDLDDVFAALRLFRHRGWEVIALHIVHPDEERLPDGVAFRFEGLENEGSIACSLADIRAEYVRRFQSHLSVVRRYALAGGYDYRLVSTAVSYVRTLQGFLVERAG